MKFWCRNGIAAKKKNKIRAQNSTKKLYSDLLKIPTSAFWYLDCNFSVQ